MTCSCKDLAARIRRRIDRLAHELGRLEDDGISRDSYNAGYLEGAIRELRMLVDPRGDAEQPATE